MDKCTVNNYSLIKAMKWSEFHQHSQISFFSSICSLAAFEMYMQLQTTPKKAMT